MSRKVKMTTMIRVREHEKVAPHLKRTFKYRRTGRENTIHNQYLNDKLNNKQKAIKKGIKFGISIIDAERDSDGNIINTLDTEARIIMCCINEQLEKLGE